MSAKNPTPAEIGEYIRGRLASAPGAYIAIERARLAWYIRYITSTGTMSAPIDRTAHKTEQEARAAAAEMGLTVKTCGDFWQILPRLI